jgi:hypothetical protein
MLLLHTVMFLLVALAFPRNSKALPDRHVRLGLCHQGIADILLAPSSPRLVVLLAQWPDGHVAWAAHEFGGCGRWLGGDGVNVHFEFLAVGFEGQVIDVVAEGVLDFAADG